MKSTSTTERPIDSSQLGRMQRMLERCAQLTQSIGKIPAVATPDWCERSSAALASVFTHADLAIILADVAESGRVNEVLSIGACAVRHGKLERQEGLDLRVRFEGMVGLPWSPDGMTIQDGSDVASKTYGRTELINTSHANTWYIPANGSLIATAALLCPQSRVRKLLTYVVLPESTERSFECMMVVRLASALLARVAHVAMGAGPGAILWLTHREQEVLDLLVMGNSVKEVSETLGRSPHTIHDHVKSLHRKLNANSRGELVAKALGHIPATQPSN